MRRNGQAGGDGDEEIGSEKEGEDNKRGSRARRLIGDRWDWGQGKRRRMRCMGREHSVDDGGRGKEAVLMLRRRSVYVEMGCWRPAGGSRYATTRMKCTGGTAGAQVPGTS